MSSTVKLKKEHLDKIIDVVQDIVDWKSQALSERAWGIFQNNWLPSLIEQLRDNEFKLNHTTRNTPLWIIDQVLHCRKLNSSGNKRNAVPLYDTLRGREAIEILKAAAKGQLYYDGWSRNSTFNELFT